MIDGIPWPIVLIGAAVAAWFVLGVMWFIVGCIADSVRPPAVNEAALKDANRRLMQEATTRS